MFKHVNHIEFSKHKNVSAIFFEGDCKFTQHVYLPNCKYIVPVILVFGYRDFSDLLFSLQILYLTTTLKILQREGNDGA